MRKNGKDKGGLGKNAADGFPVTTLKGGHPREVQGAGPFSQQRGGCGPICQTPRNGQ